jgi:micrococcal nuclease
MAFKNKLSKNKKYLAIIIPSVAFTTLVLLICCCCCLFLILLPENSIEQNDVRGTYTEQEEEKKIDSGESDNSANSETLSEETNSQEKGSEQRDTSNAGENQIGDGIDDQTIREEYELVKVIDGDTIKIMYDGEEVNVRFIGVDAQESTTRLECFGKEATNYMKDKLKDADKIRLEFDESQGMRDKYNRLLGYIYYEDQNLNNQIIRDGYAYEYTYDDPYIYQEQFLESERYARQNNLGIWGDVCESPTPTITPVPQPTNTPLPQPTEQNQIQSTPIPTATPVPTESITGACMYECDGPDRDCADFSTQNQAQDFFECCGFTATNDPMRLDGRYNSVDDGIVCESLP